MLTRITAFNAFAFGAIILIPPTVSLQAQDLEERTILICETQQYAERLVELVATDAETALDALIEETDNPDACIFSDIAYERDDTVSSIRIGSPPFEVIPIITTPDGTQSLARKKYFMLVPIEEVPA